MNANRQQLFEWTQKALCANLTYFRVRRQLFEDFLNILQPEGVTIPNEVFIVVRHFLTARNEHLDDNKKLSFDKAVLDLRQLATPPAMQRRAGMFGFLAPP